MRIDTYKKLSAGVNAIVASDTPQHLSAWDGTGTHVSYSTAFVETDVPCRSLAIQAWNTNMSTVGVGPAWTGLHMSSAWILSADSITLDVDNLNKVMVCGSANDLVSWIAIIE